MNHLGEFILNHWELWLAFAVVLIIVFINELLSQKNSARGITPQAAINLINNENAKVIDIREAELFTKGHIIDSLNASEADFAKEKLLKLKTKPVIIVCARGLQSAPLANKLRKDGFEKIMVLSGGLAAWQTADLPLVKGK